MLDAHFFRSQCGEDRILAAELAGRRSGCFVEVGSYNGESCSNTYFLEKSLGWTGVLIEADPTLFEQGRAIRPGSISVNCAAVAPNSPAIVTFDVVEGCRWISSLSVSDAMLRRIEDVPTNIKRVTVQAKTLDSILDEAGMNGPIDFLSIDVEGHEWPVLQGFSIDRWKPKIVVLERNSHFPERAIMRYMRSHAYGWRRTTGCNDWFYADERRRPLYAIRVAMLYYAPMYLTIWKPTLLAPTKRLGKRALRKLGWLDVARSLLKGNHFRLAKRQR